MYSEKSSKQFIIPIILSILIVLLTIIYLINVNSDSDRGELQAINGVLDLSDLKIDDKNTIALDGEWEFYPNALLKPEEINKDSVKTYINVPCNWTNTLNKDSHSPDGSGTYRLIVKVPKDKMYAIKTNTIRSAAKIYLNGYETGKMGTTALSADDFHRDSKFIVSTVSSKDAEIEIVILVSNFAQEIGGITKSIKFGSSEAIMYRHGLSLILDTVAFSICLILSIFFMILYMQQKDEAHFKYFAFANFFMAVFFSTLNEQILRLILRYNYNNRIIIQSIALILTSLFMTEFVTRFFNNFEKRKFSEYLFMIIIVFFTIVIYRPDKPIFLILRKLHIVLLTVIMLRYLYIFYILIKEIKKKSALSEHILMIIVSLICYWATMSTKIIFEINMGIAPAILIFILSINVWIMMSRRIKKSTEEKIERELQYFYSQISPHFLYNTLNTIIGLSYTDSEKTREALNNLSVYFRGKLDFHRTKGLVKIYSEIEMLSAYLAIEKLRYGQRLEIEYDIDEDISAVIPPLTLQPIVENAVKYGIAAKPSGGVIKISVKKHGRGIIKILIEDNGPGMSEEKIQEILCGKNERIGLKNVIEKIKIVKSSSFELKSEQDKGTRVQILLPEHKL